MKNALCFSLILSFVSLSLPVAADTITIPAETLRDKIRGGLLGQILGNLNGLPHEMKYIDSPGNVNEYTPSLPQGAVTDDDTDFEWVYIVAMQNSGNVMLPPETITQLWKDRINKRIWCSNQYARQLMDIGFEPPLTGNIVLNPWAEFNISGQFLCETFGLLAPAMPQTASRIGLNYTRVAIDGEPAQTTQFFTSMIATAFTTGDIDEIIDAGFSALDKKSAIRQITDDVRKWHKQYPDDWRTCRNLVKQKYSRHNGAMRDKNGYELNTASIVAALLYGQTDFVQTMIVAFNFGWDADCNAATAGTIIGVIKGYRWMMSQEWDIVDRYKNTTRQDMPTDETITSFADRLIDLAERTITDNGGSRKNTNGNVVYKIRTESPKNIAPLPDMSDPVAQMRTRFQPQIQSDILRGKDTRTRARAAYMAICLDLAESLNNKHPRQWQTALNDLHAYKNIPQVLYHHSPTPAGKILQTKAQKANLKKPEKQTNLW